MATEDKTLLSPSQVDEELKTLEGWQRSEAVLSRNFVFKNFRDLTAFLNHLTHTITTQNHHPDFALNTGMKMISVALTTHSEKAITRSDIQFARTLNTWKPGAESGLSDLHALPALGRLNFPQAQEQGIAGALS